MHGSSNASALESVTTAPIAYFHCMAGHDADMTTDQLPAVPESARTRFAPGLVVVFRDGGPRHDVMPLTFPAILGRGRECTVDLHDRATSRAHVEVLLGAGGWTIRDLESSNKTFVDGAQVTCLGDIAPRVLRIGKTLLLLRTDVTPHFGTSDLRVGDYVVGVRTRAAVAGAIEAAQRRCTLLVTGPSGAGKERVAAEYHHRGPHRTGPFITLNCAAIPADLIESELFGVVKGAFSGALSTRPGILASADGGALFLDEIGELSLAAQAKLLRVLQTREVVPVGGTTPRPVNVLICAATNANIRLAVAEGRFRHDLLPRLAEREVHLPALFDRPEEIPYLVQRQLEREGIENDPTGRFVEQCLLRPWAGNVRELFLAVGRAAAVARARGSKEVAKSDFVYEDMPGAHARPLIASEPPRPPSPASDFPPAASTSAPPLVTPWGSRTKAEVAEALRASGGSVTKAAKALGVQRSTFYNLMERYGIRK